MRDPLLIASYEIYGARLNVDRLLSKAIRRTRTAVWHVGDSTEFGPEKTAGFRVTIYQGNSAPSLARQIKSFILREGALLGAARRITGPVRGWDTRHGLSTDVFVKPGEPPACVTFSSSLLEVAARMGLGLGVGANYWDPERSVSIGTGSTILSEDSQFMTELEIRGLLLDVDRLLGLLRLEPKAVWRRGEPTESGEERTSGVLLAVHGGAPLYSYPTPDGALASFLQEEARLIAELGHRHPAAAIPFHTRVELKTVLSVRAPHSVVGVGLPARLLGALSTAGIRWSILSVPCSEDGRTQTGGAPSSHARPAPSARYRN